MLVSLISTFISDEFFVAPMLLKRFNNVRFLILFSGMTLMSQVVDTVIYDMWLEKADIR